jgi:predicted component of type VI protein secretion system
MAGWRYDGDGVPDLLYHPERPGWRAAALAWLDDHPGRRLPVGQYGDRTDAYVLARECRLGAGGP